MRSLSKMSENFFLNEVSLVKCWLSRSLRTKLNTSCWGQTFSRLAEDTSEGGGFMLFTFISSLSLFIRSGKLSTLSSLNSTMHSLMLSKQTKLKSFVIIIILVKIIILANPYLWDWAPVHLRCNGLTHW